MLKQLINFTSADIKSLNQKLNWNCVCVCVVTDDIKAMHKVHAPVALLKYTGKKVSYYCLHYLEML